MNYLGKVYAGAAVRQPTSEESYFVDPVTNIKVEVKRTDFEHDYSDKRSGESTFADVYKAVYNGQPYAIKKINNIMKMQSDNLPDLAFNREMSFLRKATGWQCPNIVEFYGYIRFESSAWLILQLMDRDLLEVIDSPDFYDGSGINVRDSLFPNDVIEKLGYMMLKDIANGLRFVHLIDSGGKAYMHRDIKPTNIMIDLPNRRLRIIDFGSTKEICGKEPNVHSFGAGHQLYQAPECLQDMEPEYNTSCDIWALGITMIYFFTDKHPIWDDNNQESSSDENKKIMEIYQRICGKDLGGEKVDWPLHLLSNQLSSEFKDLINKCVDRELAKRPSAEDLYNIAKEKVDKMDKEVTDSIFDTFFGCHGN